MIKKNIALCLLSIIICSCSIAQKLVDVLFVSNGKIIKEASLATGCILLKEYPDSSYERKDYEMYGTLLQTRTYKNNDLKILHGPQHKYHSNGRLSLSGRYAENKKVGNWSYFDAEGKLLYTEEYKNDSLLKLTPADSARADDKSVSYPDEREAEFKGGLKALRKYLEKNLNSDMGAKSKNGGRVEVGFMVDKEGQVKNAYIRKSVEPILDEEALRVINAMPVWVPAWQNGKAVNAYRIQPISFEVVEINN